MFDLEKGNPVVHPKILVHWTLKDESENSPEACKQRLIDILRDGLLFGSVKEKFPLFEQKVSPIEKTMLCFTETRLSQAISGPNKLPFKYGRLGIGLHRKFVVRNGGNPVFYVNAMDSANIARIMKEKEELKWFVKTMNDPVQDAQQMWDEHGFSHYDDLEWRILPDINLRLKSESKDSAPALREYAVYKNSNGKYYLKLTSEGPCLECIIFPDGKTKDSCLQTLFNFFRNGNFPIVTTLNRLKHL